MDALVDRLEQDADEDFDRMVVAVQTGTVMAHDAKAARRWASRRRSGRRGPDRSSGALSAAALERRVMGLARTNPEYVVTA